MNQQNLGSKRSASVGAGKVAAKSQEAAEQLKDAAVGQVNQVRERAQSTRSHASERIRGVATHLRDLSDTLREEDPLLADAAGRVYRRVEDLAEYVGAATPQSLVRDTERIARRQPALFYGGAIMIGLALGRFVKGASDVRWERDEDDSDDRGRDDGWTGTGAARGGAGDERRDRSSGFYPSRSDRPTRSNQRYNENYAATFATDVTPDERRAAAEAEAETTTGTGVSVPATGTGVSVPATGTGVSVPATDGGARNRGGEKGSPA
jgi:hypothetical protein